MLPSLEELLNVANCVSANSEPLTWETKHTRVFFTNTNNGEMFYLYLHQEPFSYSNGNYYFNLFESQRTIELQFFTLTLITPESLHIPI